MRGGRFQSFEQPRRGRVAVGASIWQTPGGVQAELSRINDDIHGFGAEVRVWLESHGHPADLQTFYSSVLGPWLVRWDAFYEANKGWLDNLWWNHAPEAEQFLAQLTDMRKQVAAHGMRVESPAPAVFSPSLLLDPGHNMIDRGAAAAGDLWNSLGTAGKVALYGGVALLGTIAIASLASNLRSGKDPASNYLALARRK